MRKIMSEWNSAKKEIWILLVIVFAGWVVGEIITGVVMYTDKYAEMFSVGGITAMTAALIIVLIVSIVQMMISYELAISMGRTRREFLLGMSICIMLQTIIIAAFTILVSHLGHVTKALLYPNREWASDTEFVGIITFDVLKTYWWVLAILIILPPILGCTVCGLIKRFGSKAAWCLWAVYMIFVLIAPNIIRMLDDSQQGSFLWQASYVLSHIPAGAYVVVATGVILSLFLWNVKYLLKARVG